MRYDFWLDRPVDPTVMAAAMRNLFELPADEDVYVGVLEQAPLDADHPRVRVLTNMSPAGGDFGFTAEVVARQDLEEQLGGMQPDEVGSSLAEALGAQVLFPENHDGTTWVLARPDATLTPVTLDQHERRHKRLRVAEEARPEVVPVQAGQPVEPPRKAVPLATLLAARDYLRDQMVTAATNAYPGRNMSVKELQPAVGDWRPHGSLPYHGGVRVALAEERPDWSAERAVRNLSRAFADLGWQVREPTPEKIGEDGVRWDGGAQRSGYIVGILMHQKQGIIYLTGQTPEFRLHRWDTPD